MCHNGYKFTNDCLKYGEILKELHLRKHLLEKLQSKQEGKGKGLWLLRKLVLLNGWKTPKGCKGVVLKVKFEGVERYCMAMCRTMIRRVHIVRDSTSSK